MSRRRLENLLRRNWPGFHLAAAAAAAAVTCKPVL
jgi:hypothetical protein